MYKLYEESVLSLRLRLYTHYSNNLRKFVLDYAQFMSIADEFVVGRPSMSLYKQLIFCTLSSNFLDYFVNICVISN